MTDNKSFQIYKDLGSKLSRLSREEKGAILEAIFAFENGEPIPEDMPLGACIAWDFIKPMLEAAEEKYQEASAKRSEAGKAGATKRWSDSKAMANDSKAMANDSKGIAKEESIKNKDIKEKDSKESKKKLSPVAPFVPPSVEEVKAYCDERKNTIDAATFVDFYSSKSWRVGCTKMADWKAAVRTWERRQDKDVGKQSDKMTRSEQDAFIMSLT